MISKVIMPQGGQDIEKGTVVNWWKKEGDPVLKGETICEVETEKATFEVASPAEGYLRKILVPMGGETAILSVIGIVGDLNDPIETGEDFPPSETSTSTFLSLGVAQDDKGLYMPEEERIKISPRARKFALANHVPLQQLQSLKPLGRIVEKDVLEYLEKQKGAQTAFADEIGKVVKKIIPLTKTWQWTARRTQKSKQTIPHFYVTRAIDMTRALKYRLAINEKTKSSNGETISINDMIVRACALAIQEFPEINASFSDKEQVILWENINIGIAVALDDGLIAPVLENANYFGLHQLSKKTSILIDLARQGKLPSMAPARFTVSNLGMFNIDNFIAIINPPEAAILAVSSIKKQIIVQDDMTFAIRDMLNTTLSIDHRVCNGVLACKFINLVKSLLETPERLA